MITYLKNNPLDAKAKADKPKRNFYKEGEVLVKYKSGVSYQQVLSDAGARNFSVKTHYKTLSSANGRVYVRMTSSAKTTQQMMEALKKDAMVEWAEPNYIYKLQAIPNDTDFGSLWGMDNTGQTGGTPDADIDAPEAWNTRTDASSVVIGVLDTGVDYNHPDLAANIWTAGDGSHGYNAITGTTDPMDDNSHGTHCSGTIGGVGNNSAGVAGVCWNVKIMGLKFLDAGGSGSTDDAVEALDWALAQKLAGVNLVATSNSWGGGGYSQTLYDIIALHGQNGIAFIAAAGNEGMNTDYSPNYPSCYDVDNIIAVAATDHNDQLAYFSNYGYNTVDMAAPGVDIYSTVITTTYDQSIFFDDMESGVGSWITHGTNNSWAITDETSYSPTHSWSDSPYGAYLDYTDSYLEWDQAFDLSGYVGQPVALGASVILDTEGGCDWVSLEISTDDGANWTSLGGYSGNTGGNWAPIQFEIPDAFKTSTVRFRNYFHSDGSVTYDGEYIDDIWIGVGATTHGYGTKSGTSMATPHAAGAYALISAQYPAEPMSKKIDRIVWGGDIVSGISGYVLSGRRLNLASAIDSNLVLPPRIYTLDPDMHLYQGQAFTITGANFMAGDAVVFYSWYDGSEYNATITSLNATTITGTAPNTTEGACYVFIRHSNGQESNYYIGCTFKTDPYTTELFDADDNDIDNQTLTFTPDGSSDYYSVCRTSAASFPTNPENGTVVSLNDDDYSYVALSGGQGVYIYGSGYGGFYINSNGYITFDGGDTVYSESISNHFNGPRISGLFDDLNPTEGGTISWMELADRAVVTYQDVSETGSANANSFQIEMFFNGVIRITHLNIEAMDGLVGLSPGYGIPWCYSESDISNLAACSGNDMTVYEDAEDGLTTGWDIYDNVPAGAVISNVVDAARTGKVIQLAGSGANNGYRLRNPDGSAWNNTSQFIFQWAMKCSENYAVYIQVNTTEGVRYLTYTQADTDALGEGTYVYHGLGAASKNGTWQTFTRDLQADLAAGQPWAAITSVNYLMVKGSMLLDDIRLHQSAPETVYEDGEDGLTTGWDIYDNDPAGAVISNVLDAARNSFVINLSGYGVSNGYRIRKADGTNWQNTSEHVIQWKMKTTENYAIYVQVATSVGTRYITYTQAATDALGTGSYVYQGLGASTRDGKWHTITRDLQTDLFEGQPAASIIAVNALLIKGSMSLDDMKLMAMFTHKEDSDGDGLSDIDELNVHLTDPYNPDTDNDGFNDDVELAAGTNPRDAASSPPSVYENGEDWNPYNRWKVFDDTPASAYVEPYWDDAVGSVVNLVGDGQANGFKLRNADGTDWKNSHQFFIQWKMKTTETFTIYVQVATTAGTRYLTYSPATTDALGTGTYVWQGLGAASKDGTWHTFARDLKADFAEAQGATITAVNAFLVRGNMQVDDIQLLSAIPKTIYEDAEDGTTDGWTVYDADPAGAYLYNAFDTALSSNVIGTSGAGSNNGYRLRNADGTSWNNTNQYVIQWKMNCAENYALYVMVATTAGTRYLTYTPVDTDALGTGSYIYYGLGAASKDGTWRAFTRDLQADLSLAQPGASITAVNAFLVKGSMRLDDISLQ